MGPFGDYSEAIPNGKPFQMEVYCTWGYYESKPLRYESRSKWFMEVRVLKQVSALEHARACKRDRCLQKAPTSHLAAIPGRLVSPEGSQKPLCSYFRGVWAQHLDGIWPEMPQYSTETSHSVILAFNQPLRGVGGQVVAQNPRKGFGAEPSFPSCKK